MSTLRFRVFGGLLLALLATSSVQAATSRWIFGYTDGPLYNPRLRLTDGAGSSEVNSSDRGWYTASGLHDPLNTNYFVGIARNDTGGGNEFVRNWFLFDVPATAAGPYSAAELLVELPDTSAGIYGGFFSGLPGELYGLFDVTTNFTDLVAGLGGVAAYGDLGNGVSFGQLAVSEADEGTVLTIPLNAAALVSINAAAGQAWAVGGSLPIPEPAGAILMALGLAGFVAARIRRRK